MSIFIAFIMITSIFGVMFYGFSSPGETYRYDGKKFEATPEGFELKFKGETYTFELLPQDVEDVPVDEEAIASIMNAPLVVLTSDPNSLYARDIAISSFNINTILTKQGQITGNAFTQPGAQLPVITCDNASTASPVIYFIQASETAISYEAGCTLVQFNTGFNLQRASSRLAYALLNIIK
jgi:hypothetical protein